MRPKSAQEYGLAGIGSHYPDKPPAWQLEPDSITDEIHRDTMEQIGRISAEDWALLAGLEDGYPEKSARDFLAELAELAGLMNSTDTMPDTIATLAYAGMHDAQMEPNDFYASLYFTLQEYYRGTGNPSLADASYYSGTQQ